MFKVDEKLTIHITRGDMGLIKLTAENGDEDYTFSVGDVVRLQVMDAKDCSTIVLRKDVTVDEETTEVNINLNHADTKIGSIINKPTVYWYEIELNPLGETQTLVGYDDTGAKQFILYPEGRDSND